MHKGIICVYVLPHTYRKCVCVCVCKGFLRDGAEVPARGRRWAWKEMRLLENKQRLGEQEHPVAWRRNIPVVAPWGENHARSEELRLKTLPVIE